MKNEPARALTRSDPRPRVGALTEVRVFIMLRMRRVEMSVIFGSRKVITYKTEGGRSDDEIQSSLRE